MAKAAVPEKDKDFIKKYGDYITTGEKILETKRELKRIYLTQRIYTSALNFK